MLRLLLTPVRQTARVRIWWAFPMQDDKLHDEAARLAALHRYEILDTGEEEPFTRIVDLVQAIMAVPMASVSLIDADRQWLKASVGPLDKQMRREIAFCNETIQHHGPLAVPDA